MSNDTNFKLYQRENQARIMYLISRIKKYQQKSGFQNETGKSKTRLTMIYMLKTNTGNIAFIDATDGLSLAWLGGERCEF